MVKKTTQSKSKPKTKTPTKNKNQDRNIVIDTLMIVPGLVLTGLVIVKLVPVQSFHFLFVLQCIGIIYLGFVMRYLPGFNRRQGFNFAYRGKLAQTRAIWLLLFTVGNFIFNIYILPLIFQ